MRPSPLLGLSVGLFCACATYAESRAPDASASADDAGGGSCNQAAACERVVFVTSATYTGALGGLEGADKACTALAAQSSLERVRGRGYRAWLSTATAPVSARLVHGTGAYVTTGGARIAASWDVLVGGTLESAIGNDENGARIGSNYDVFTGTSPSGMPSSTAGCSDWTEPTGAGSVRKGTASHQDALWTYDGYADCKGPARLYCFED